MSKKNKNKHLNNVSGSKLETNKIKISMSNIDISKIINEINKNSYKDDEYKAFCKKHINSDFSQYKIEKLKNIYEVGNGLLNQYFIVEDSTCENSILIQLQYIISSIMYHINIKQTYNTNQQNNALNKKLEKTIERAEKLEKDAKQRAGELRHVKNDIKSIITTIISIILAISIIPTAIAGIEKINPNYILPFMSSIILFGMIMIVFVYSIYQEKIKISTKILLTVTIIICILLWILSFKVNICKVINENLEDYKETNCQIQDKNEEMKENIIKK